MWCNVTIWTKVCKWWAEILRGIGTKSQEKFGSSAPQIVVANCGVTTLFAWCYCDIGRTRGRIRLQECLPPRVGWVGGCRVRCFDIFCNSRALVRMTVRRFSLSMIAYGFCYIIFPLPFKETRRDREPLLLVCTHPYPPWHLDITVSQACPQALNCHHICISVQVGIFSIMLDTCIVESKRLKHVCYSASS